MPKSASATPQGTPVADSEFKAGFTNDQTAASSQTPSNGLDYGGWALGFIASVLTFGQLEPARSVLATAGIVIGLLGFWTLRHRRTTAKWAVPTCGVGVVTCLVLMQTVAAGDSKSQASPTPTVTVTRTVAPSVTMTVSSTPVVPEVIGGGVPSTQPKAPSLPPTDSPQAMVGTATGEIKQTESKTFFRDALRVGVSNVYDTHVSLNLATSDSECSGGPSTGQSVVIRDPVGYWYRVAVLRSRTNTSVLVEVSRGTGTSPSGQLCM